MSIEVLDTSYQARQKKIKSKPLRKEKTMRHLFIFFLCIICIGIQASPIIVGNETCRAFPNQCDVENLSGGGDSKPADITSIGFISQYIRRAAFYFLKSKSNWANLSSEIELTGNICEGCLEYAITYIQLSAFTYYDLYVMSLNLEYDQIVIDKLKQFDYQNFKESENLNSEIFDLVTEYLQEGKIKGLYFKFYTMISDIRNLLISYKANPSIKKLWEISEKYATFQIFGQYVTRVFYSL